MLHPMLLKRKLIRRFMCSKLSNVESHVNGEKMYLGKLELLCEKMIPFLPHVAVTEEEGGNPNRTKEKQKARKGNKKESIRKTSCI